MTKKQAILKALEDLPDEVTVDQAIERLILLYKVERGLQQAQAGQKVSQEEARSRMSRWLS
jgi:predicted transcriptional regulator